MADSASSQDEQARQAAASPDHARRALTGLARDRGAQFHTHPLSRDSGWTVHDLEPLAGALTARDIELAAVVAEWNAGWKPEP